VHGPVGLREDLFSNLALYRRALSLHPGRYRLDILVQDVNGNKLEAASQALIIPEYSQGKLASSSLILADAMQPVAAASSANAGDKFVLGDMLVSPKIAYGAKPVTFVKGEDQQIHVWMQVYNLTRDEKTNKFAAVVQYRIVNTATGNLLVYFNERTDVTVDQLTVSKRLPLSHVGPGVYRIMIKIDDSVSQQTISSETAFAVK
jgi:hypothetical protein